MALPCWHVARVELGRLVDPVRGSSRATCSKLGRRYDDRTTLDFFGDQVVWLP